MRENWPSAGCSSCEQCENLKAPYMEEVRDYSSHNLEQYERPCICTISSNSRMLLRTERTNAFNKKYHQFSISNCPIPTLLYQYPNLIFNLYLLLNPSAGPLQNAKKRVDLAKTGLMAYVM